MASRRKLYFVLFCPINCGFNCWSFSFVKGPELKLFRFYGYERTTFPSRKAISELRVSVHPSIFWFNYDHQYHGHNMTELVNFIMNSVTLDASYALPSTIPTRWSWEFVMLRNKCITLRSVFGPVMLLV